MMYGQTKTKQQPAGWNYPQAGDFNQPPCRYSAAELNKRAQIAIADYEAGERLIPHAQIQRKGLL